MKDEHLQKDSFSWTYEPPIKAGYLKLSEKKICNTLVLVENHVIVDRDVDGDVVGIEILL